MLGHDPRGIDGILGPGSRSAIRSWQGAAGFPASGFLDAAQLQALKAASQGPLDAWLKNPDNRQRHAPVVVSLTPARIGGTWRFTATCDRKSRLPGQRINGVMALRVSKAGSFSGTLSNSQGLRARVSGSVQQRNVTAQMNWGFLFGKSTFRGRFTDNARRVHGRDSNGCNITLSKG